MQYFCQSYHLGDLQEWFIHSCSSSIALLLINKWSVCHRKWNTAMCPCSWHSLRSYRERVWLGCRKSLSTVIKLMENYNNLVQAGFLMARPFRNEGFSHHTRQRTMDSWGAFLRAKRIWNGLLKTITNISKDHVTSCRNEIRFVIV